MPVFTIVAPIFALIAIGYLAARTRFLSAAAHKGLAEFAFTLAMPALLFRTVANAKLTAVSPVKLWLVYFGMTTVVWIIATAATRLLLRRPAIDAPAIAITSVYGNIVMVGIPLCLATFGEAAAAPMAMIVAINTPLLWFVGSMHFAWASRAAAQSPVALALSIGSDLARNPLIVAIIAGSIWRLTGLGLHPLIESCLALLGQAGIPVALVSLGVSLAGFAIAGQAPTLITVLLLKLVLMPVVAAYAAYIAELPPVAAGVVILFAAMPSGANAYLFAAKVERAVDSASGAAALGTLLSVVTSMVLVALLTGRQ